MILKMLTRLEWKNSVESFNKKIENIKRTQS